MRNYLIASDLSSRSLAAIGRAVALLAAELEAGVPARLTLLHVMDDSLPLPPDPEASLRAQLGDVAHAGHIDLLCRGGDPDQVILAVADELDAHLILMGVPRPRRFLQGLAGTTAERVVSETSRPLAVIRNTPSRQWRHVMLALDSDESASQLIALAQERRLLADADVTVLQATNLPGPGQLRTGGLSSVDLQNLDMHAMAEREHRLRRRLRHHFAPGHRLDFAMRHGAAAEAILALQSDNQFDLVVMGARGRGRLMRRVLGSTSAEIIERIDTDLLCIPLSAG